MDYRRNWVGKREACEKLVPDDYPVEITKEINLKESTIIEGSFLSPFANFIPDLMPEETRRAKYIKIDEIVLTLKLVNFKINVKISILNTKELEWTT